MITLSDKDTGAAIGSISEEDFELLEELLEEESRRDTDYYFEVGTIELIESEGGSPELVALLRQALGNREGIEIAWTRA